MGATYVGSTSFILVVVFGSIAFAAAVAALVGCILVGKRDRLLSARDGGGGDDGDDDEED
jgi:hypothetical protein